MKNLFKGIITLALVLVSVLALASCDKSSSIKKAYEKEEYTVTETTIKEVYDNKLVGTIVKTAIEKNYNEDQRKKLESYSIILATKSLDYALIIKFPGDSDVKNFLTVTDKDGNTDTSAYDNAKNNGNINGNCLLAAASNNAKNLFK